MDAADKNDAVEAAKERFREAVMCEKAFGGSQATIAALQAMMQVVGHSPQRFTELFGALVVQANESIHQRPVRDQNDAVVQEGSVTLNHDLNALLHQAAYQPELLEAQITLMQAGNFYKQGNSSYRGRPMPRGIDAQTYLARYVEQNLSRDSDHGISR